MSDNHHHMTQNMSKEDKHISQQQSSFENIMDAVVSIHGGEVSLKNNNTAQAVKRN